MLGNETVMVTTRNNIGVPIACLLFFIFALYGHFMAWKKISQAETIDVFEIINDRTKVCYFAFNLVNSNPMFWIYLSSLGLLLWLISVRRNYSLTTQFALFFPLFSFLFLYGAGVSYLGLKFINLGIA